MGEAFLCDIQRDSDRRHSLVLCKDLRQIGRRKAERICHG